MRTGAISGRHGEMRSLLTQRARLTVKETRVRVKPVAKWCGETRIEQRSFWQNHFEQVVKALIEQHFRIESHDHVNPEE
jgi:hypothetical protein